VAKAPLNSDRELLPALDEIETGIVLLGADLKARFANRAFLEMWNMSPRFFEAEPDFGDIMRHVTTFRDIAPNELEDYIEKRTRLVREGKEDPRNIRINSDKVVRVTCKALPDGGRMLLYSDITDLVKHAERLEHMAMTDSLTGLFNRRHFFSVAEQEWERFRRFQQPFSIVMIDIDKFKAINDNFGHAVGDKVILSVADSCRASKREYDIAARIGGEEFALLLPETTLPKACAFADRLREAISEHALDVSGERLSFTTSMGVSEATVEMTDVDQLVIESDDALYAAKRQGRNLVCAAR
jgi:diguanylate cyclase (GGDEF)-like protein